MGDAAVTRFAFDSADGASTVRAVAWASGDVAAGAPPRAVVQLVHGMGEHIGRYDRFAEFLAAQGFLVCGHDQIGHGRTAGCPEGFGILPGRDPVGFMLRDIDHDSQGIPTLRGNHHAHIPPFLLSVLTV